MQNSTPCNTHGLCHLKNSEWEKRFPNYKGRVVVRGDAVKDDSGSNAVFTEQGFSAYDSCRSSGCDLQTIKMRRTSKWIGLHPSEDGRRSKVIETPGIGMSNNLNSSTSKNRGTKFTTLWYRFEETCTDTYWQDCTGSDKLERS